MKDRYRCPNCAVSLPPRQCPAYKDNCKYCGNIGHWAKCCRKKKVDERQQKDRRQKRAGMSRSQSRPRSQSRHRSRCRQDRQTSIPVHEMSGYHTENEGDDYETGGETYTKSVNEIMLSTKNVDTMREEAYTNLKIVCSDIHELKLKSEHRRFWQHHTNTDSKRYVWTSVAIQSRTGQTQS